MFDILAMLPEIHSEYEMKCFPQYWMANPNLVTILGNVQWWIVKQQENSEFS